MVKKKFIQWIPGEKIPLDKNNRCWKYQNPKPWIIKKIEQEALKK